MKVINKILPAALAVTLVGAFVGCDKTKPYDIITADPEVHFISSNRDLAYYVEDNANSTFSIEVGTTNVSSQDRTVTYKITSPTGAVSGTHYSTVPAGNATVTIPAGESKATIVIHGVFAPYADGTRKDTLQITLAEPSIKAAKFNDTINLILQRYCTVDLADFTGDYKCQDYYNGAPDGGPYTVTLAPGTSTGTNTGYVMLTGLWGVANPPVRINLDWNNPANFTTTIVKGNWFVDSDYGQSTINPSGAGTFSSCDNTFTIRFEATVAAGSFGKYVTVLTK